MEFALTTRYEDPKSFLYNNYISYSYDGSDDEQFLKFDHDSLVIFTNPSFHFVDFMLFKKKTATYPPGKYINGFHSHYYIILNKVYIC